MIKPCLPWVRAPGPAFQDNMLVLNILDDISNRGFKIALVTLLKGLENIMFSVKQVNPGLVWKCIKYKKEVASMVLYVKR